MSIRYLMKRGSCTCKPVDGKFIMVIYYKQNCKRQIFHLLSYLEEFSSMGVDTIEFDPSGSFDEIENSKENYLLFSNMMPRDLTRNRGIIRNMKEKFRSLRLNIVFGGTLFYITDNEDLLRHLPEITHICVGKGEAFLKELIEKRLPGGVYYGKNFPLIEHYLIKEKYLKKISRALITFDDNRCKWGKCKFCHHTPAEIRRKRVSVETLLKEVLYYYEFGLKEFYFYDNEMDPKKLYEFLGLFFDKIGPDPEISFRIFGVRADSDFSIIKGVLWRPHLIEEVSIGVEFYSQTLLDLYNKGVTKAQIDETIQTFLDLGATVNVYLLFGVPGARAKHIEGTRSFIDKYDGNINYFPSFFRLSSDIPHYRERASFRVKTGDPYKISEMVGGKTLPPTSTESAPPTRVLLTSSHSLLRSTQCPHSCRIARCHSFRCHAGAYFSSTAVIASNAGSPVSAPMKSMDSTATSGFGLTHSIRYSRSLSTPVRPLARSVRALFSCRQGRSPGAGSPQYQTSCPPTTGNCTAEPSSRFIT